MAAIQWHYLMPQLSKGAQRTMLILRFEINRYIQAVIMVRSQYFTQMSTFNND